MEKTLKQFFNVIWFICASAIAQNSPLPEAQSNIEYKSVSEAMAALRAKTGTEISLQNNWTIVSEPALHVIWSFAPEGNSAYPSVVKRVLTQNDGKIGIEMGVICQASKNACDGLVREFIQLNENIRSSFQEKN
jgi:hypothetical protein